MVWTLLKLLSWLPVHVHLLCEHVLLEPSFLLPDFHYVHLLL
jgi:hypothetical protein